MNQGANNPMSQNDIVNERENRLARLNAALNIRTGINRENSEAVEASRQLCKKIREDVAVSHDSLQRNAVSAASNVARIQNMLRSLEGADSNLA